MKEKIEQLLQELNEVAISTKQQLEEFRLNFLSKKGKISILFEDFKSVSSDQKKEIGQFINQLKQKAETLFNEKKDELENAENAAGTDIDKTLPVQGLVAGAAHPVNIVKNQIIDIFERLGFTLSDGPEIEDDWHNFSALNFPENHPARDMQDTFFITKNMALRTHTSSVQIRVMEQQKPPIRTLSPGRVYRNEAVSSRSNCFFHQIEGLYIDKNVSFADLKQTLYYFVAEFFGERNIRFRPSYFPFTEPSAEMDIYLGTETEADYRLTKGTGWLEILGCGMVDPNVLKNCGIDPEEYSGFAFGMGIERITMLKYDVKDLRTFFENDIRFLKQFSGEF